MHLIPLLPKEFIKEHKFGEGKTKWGKKGIGLSP